ncbi:DUF6297 family protein [Streptomyces nojiriensis]|uniref:DUF6297 family protein n=1 Tax=Streptomyces nojiriensis TaxID=66374 RepID=UPI0035DDD2B0
MASARDWDGPAGRPPAAGCVGTTLVLFAGQIALYARLGPVLLSPAEITWLLPLPGDRGRLLRPRLARAVAVACATALPTGALAAALALALAVRGPPRGAPRPPGAGLPRGGTGHRGRGPPRPGGPGPAARRRSGTGALAGATCSPAAPRRPG